MKKVALITGGTRGIGRGIAEKLAEAGFNLVISGIRDAASVSETVRCLEGLGAEVLYCASDVSNEEDRKELLAATKARFGRLDVLVNNAGVAPNIRTDILEALEESFERVMKINLQGPYFLTQAVATWMLVQKSYDADHTGVIINIGSISAEIVSIKRGEYCVSKAGISMMTRLFAARLGGHDIHVYEIRPGMVKTDMTSKVEDSYTRLIEDGELSVIKRWGTPADVGTVAVAMATGQLPYCVGQVVTVDGGVTLPRL
ncbi:MAG: 3-ketoacyl-ACP reductase [Kiritimatiellae bacterium]|nr:3-ketoacyl-ACP reductase [Kiritimatiellia bacterium]